MDSYPSLDRVKAEQKIRKEKLELTSALLDLRVINFKEAKLGSHEEELKRVNLLKNRFIESVNQFLNSFGHEVCDDDRILYRNEITDIETKVQEHSNEVRKQAHDFKTLQQYKSILDKGKGKGQKLETIFELCREIDENGADNKFDEDVEQTSRNGQNNSRMPQRKSTSATNQRNSVIHEVAFPMKKENCWESSEEDKKTKFEEEKRNSGKATISYSVKKEITETMTLIKED